MRSIRYNSGNTRRRIGHSFIIPSFVQFHLTHASYRIFGRASRLRLQAGISAISAAKILWAIFEEECRAAHWLADAGLTFEQFKTAFGIQTLQSPVSAPAFPAGSYGISPGQYPLPPQPSAGIETASAGNNAPPVGQPFPNPLPPEEENIEETAADIAEQDDWKQTEPPQYTLYDKTAGKTAGQNRLHFYLDDQRADFGLIAPELENNLVLIARHFTRPHCLRQPISAAGGGIMQMTNNVSAFTLATEHLLLAAVLDNSDTGRWLQEKGFDPAELYNRIGQLTAESDSAAGMEPLSAEDGTKNDDVKTEIPELPPPFYRLLDAAANRCMESMRVIEDCVRFIWDDAELTQQLKTFRHDFQFVLQKFPMAERLSARDTEQDVGTKVSACGEYRRYSPADVIEANFSRLQEALRSLEEWTKIFDSAAAEQFERQRYQCYTLHKAAAKHLTAGRIFN
jgi:hypothetical protein